ncbi:CD63 antigen, putative [Pediculus humanus corporis]|uniref:CD63 antigen, putative n=1 Tax=Pediculus humanus subsp. corporis TaxID=121224 RepID=E0VTU1_PEDHC|nr:CD63 antigen, putative [Pediculus humanus corporis]EEB16797.1 CD63 antigen, putative [Pediculus humanus corporis]
MSSIFLVYIAATAHELFSDINRMLSPSLLLPVIGVFIVLLAGVGYVGIARQSSTLISIYTQLLVFIFALEIAAGLGVLSYRDEIRSMASNKMKKAIYEYPNDPFTANLVDYLRCCGVNNYWDWDNVLVEKNYTKCQGGNTILPESCCRKINSTMEVNKRGCLTAVNFMLHKSSLFLALGIMTVSTIQILGTYFSYSLATSLRKFKLQQVKNHFNIGNENVARQTERNEKSNHY